MSRSQSNSGIQYSQTPEYRLETIPIALNKAGIMFSKTVAAKLVGGRTRLYRLIEHGKIRFEKKALGTANGKWYCNGGDVIRHIKL